MEQKDIRLFGKLVVLAKKQLASIEGRLSNSQTGKLNEFIFKLRHAKIKTILVDILSRREAAVGNGAILELIDDLKNIGEDEKDWQSVDEKETDYLRFVLHGIKAAPEDDDEADPGEEN